MITHLGLRRLHRGGGKRAGNPHCWLVSVTLLFAVLVVAALCTAPPVSAQERGPIYTAEIDGVVTSVKADYLRRVLQTAEASDATALIITLSNNGAVLEAIRPLAAELADASIPIVVYVAPAGQESGAAGAFLLSASDIAAMAPDSSFGTPVPLAAVDETLSEQTQDLVLDSVVEQLREWNEAQGRNTDWIDAGVREGIVRTSGQALATEPPTIDLVANDTDELLVLLQGRTVAIADEEITLDTLGRTPTPLPPSLWEQFLILLTDPTVTFLLLMLGFIAIYAEFVSPGGAIAASIGVVLLLGALIGLLVLPVNYLSVFGLLLAFGLIFADLYVPSAGALSVGGAAILLVSALTLIDAAQAPNVVVALPVILIIVTLVGIFSALGLWLVVRTRNTPIATGQEGLVGRLARVRQPLDPQGVVFVEGALWRAVSENGMVAKDEYVRIVSVHDLLLVVRPLDEDAATDEIMETDGG